MIEKKYFGQTMKNEDIYVYTINEKNIIVEISTYGAAIMSLKVKDKYNAFRDIVLGYDCVSGYEQQDDYLGCVVGRCCNRISDATFILHNKKYILSKNEENNHLHGGVQGFNKKIWQATILDSKSLKLTYISGDNEEGYPGKLTVSVVYKLMKNRLYISYYAKSTKDTICNLTNHTYFNLEGYKNNNILNHYMKIYANKFTEDNDRFLPTGKILSVEGTPIDFRKGEKIGTNINKDYYQIANAQGYNVNYILKNYKNNIIIHYATVYAEKSGIMMKAYTDMPCVQFYTGNFLTDKILGKDATPIVKYNGFCLEPQFAPNAINMSNVIKPILKKRKLFYSCSFYEFITSNEG